MQHVLVFAPIAATRTLYSQELMRHHIIPYPVKDPAELFLQLVTFEIDTLVLVDEDSTYHISVVLDVLKRKYEHKRVIVVSPVALPRWVPRHFERLASTQDFFDLL
jgi:hypothetical protein